MQKWTYVFLVLFAVVLSVFAEQLRSTGTMFFSPHGGGTNSVVRELNVAKTEVLVQA